jgi:hypothetical protein
MTLASWLFTGGAIGVLSGLTLWWTVARLRPDASSYVVVLVLGGMILRWSLSAGLLVAALQHGIVPGLLAFAGLLLARWGMVYWFNLHA